MKLLPELLDWVRTELDFEPGPRALRFAIEGLIYNGRGEDAVNEIVKMVERDVKPLVATRSLVTKYWSMKMNQLCKEDKVDEIRVKLAWLRKSGVYVVGETYNLIVETYIRNNLILQARDVLHKMSRDGELPEKKYFAQIVRIYVDNNDYEEANAVLEDMDASATYVPRALSDIVYKGLESTNPVLAKEVQEAAAHRSDIKYLYQQLEETYKL